LSFASSSPKGCSQRLTNWTVAHFGQKDQHQTKSVEMLNNYCHPGFMFYRSLSSGLENIEYRDLFYKAQGDPGMLTLLAKHSVLSKLATGMTNRKNVK